MHRPLLALAALVVLAACEEAAAPPSAPRTEAPDPRLAAAMEAAAAPLRHRLRHLEEPRQRGVQVFAQAIKGSYAVCGRVAASDMPGDALVPYVAVVAFEAEAPRVTEFLLGSSPAEATRVFLALSERCFEGGGPPHARAVAQPLPPLPQIRPGDALSGASMLPVAASGGGAGTPALRQALRSITTTSRHGANIRNAPRGTEVLRTVPRSTTLEVYAESPGGWFEVGLDGETWGWVHASVLEDAAR